MQFSSIQEELAIIKFKKSIERRIEDYFEGKGFSLIEPKVFQSYDDFLLSNFRQDSSKTVKVLGGDSRIFILRPDITTNILSGIFSKWDGNTPLNVYYNSKIYQNKAGGRIEEKYQMGVESLGAEARRADREILEMAGLIMETLNQPYILELGSSKYLDEFFKTNHLDYADELELRGLIKSKNRHGLSLKLTSLGLEDTILKIVLDLQGDLGKVVTSARSHPLRGEMDQALNALEELKTYFQSTDLFSRIRLDLSMMPDLDYYDGIIFKGYCSGVPKKIVSGGRYDRLTERFGRKVPAIGFVTDMDLVTRILIKGERQ